MSEPIVADIVKLQNCSEKCPCQSVHIDFLLDDRTCFASIPLDPESARKLAKDLQAAADVADAQKAKIKRRVQ